MCVWVCVRVFIKEATYLNKSKKGVHWREEGESQNDVIVLWSQKKLNHYFKSRLHVSMITEAGFAGDNSDS